MKLCAFHRIRGTTYFFELSVFTEYTERSCVHLLNTQNETPRFYCVFANTRKYLEYIGEFQTIIEIF
jgi:hypothetical protein